MKYIEEENSKVEKQSKGNEEILDNQEVESPDAGNIGTRQVAVLPHANSFVVFHTFNHIPGTPGFFFAGLVCAHPEPNNESIRVRVWNPDPFLGGFNFNIVTVQRNQVVEWHRFRRCNGTD